MIGQIIILGILLALSSFFSGVETALISINMVKVRSLLRQKKKNAEILFRLKQNPHRLIITILVWNNLVNIASASLATVVMTEFFGSYGLGMATGIMTFLILVFGEISPKTYAAQNAEKISLAVARPIEILSIAMYPISKFFEIISKITTGLFEKKEVKEVSQDELRTIVTMGREEGILTKETAEMMENILEFEKTTATEIMTPRIDMEMIDGNKKLKDVLNFLIKMSYSRYPVYLNEKDNIIGILDVYDVLKHVKNNKTNILIKSLVKEVFFIPESKEIDDLLTEFEFKDNPLAIVVNEYGVVEGLVTVEDILEEIVGDIFDKSRVNTLYIKKIGKNKIRADGRALIEDINKAIKIDIQSKQFNTISGFIQHRLQKIPEKGDLLKMNKFTISVDGVTKTGIKRVTITKH